MRIIVHTAEAVDIVDVTTAPEAEAEAAAAALGIPVEWLAGDPAQRILSDARLRRSLRHGRRAERRRGR